MLRAVLNVLDEQLGMTRGAIMLLAPGREEINVEVAHNLSDRASRPVRYEPGEGIVGRVIQQGAPEVVPKVSEDPRFLDRLHRRQRATGEATSFICVPITIDNDVIGALSADHVYNARIDLDEDVRTLSIVASLIAKDVRARREAARERQALEAENLRLKHALQDRFRPENIVGSSSAMREVYQAIYQVAGSDTTVLLRGESGTGKGLVAQAIHYASPRADGPFVQVNCAALSESLLESELFGHTKGAFTGATQTRTGRLEQADGGTLLLDEIGDFSPATQVKLLRVLQDKEFEPVGSNETRRANVRVLVATNVNLEQAVERGAFREDLYYRVNVFPLMLPPLRRRKEDIPLLADHFVEKHAGRMSKDVRRITTPAINMMVSYHWPGNVRELENCIERAVLLTTDGVIHAHHLPPTLQTSDASDTIGTGTFAERVALFERDVIVDALKRTGGNVAAAARDLGSTARVIGYKVDKLGIDAKRYKRVNG
ncbi:MAG: sigma 54-interacting transcriptional regulator [Phycisphaerae bacterium]|nr:sigma 54-interacting transcriptional regulator [Phycisphaerae bacterium]